MCCTRHEFYYFDRVRASIILMIYHKDDLNCFRRSFKLVTLRIRILSYKKQLHGKKLRTSHSPISFHLHAPGHDDLGVALHFAPSYFIPSSGTLISRTMNPIESTFAMMQSISICATSAASALSRTFRHIRMIYLAPAAMR